MAATSAFQYNDDSMETLTQNCKGEDGDRDGNEKQTGGSKGKVI